MRKLVYKTLVDDIEPMDADTLEAVRICGWRVVCKKGDFHVGDTVLYFEPDAALNCHDDRFAFLRERCYKKFNAHGKLFDECIRIRTMKLRGVVSQGLLMKPELFCEVRNKKLGEDCSDVLMVRHYDEVAEKAAYECQPLRAANQKGGFPSWIPKTDEERVQNLNDETLTEYKGIRLEVTEKRDGTSMTIFYAPTRRPDDPLGVCSRNFELKDMPSSYWDAVHKYQLDKKLRFFCDTCYELAVQGELTGPGIGGNRDNFEDLTFSVFRIWDITNQRWLTWEERLKFCEVTGMEHVPVLDYTYINNFCSETGNPRDWTSREEWNPTLARDNILKFAEGKTVRGNEREGVVFKSNDGSFSFKAVSNKYLLGLK